MRKLLIFAGVTFVTLLLAYVVWIQFPKVSDPQFVQQIIVNGQSYMARGQAGALDRSKNGYLSKEFLPYWGRKGKEHVPNSAVESTVKSWLSFSSSGQGQFVDHHQLQKSKDPNYLKARAAFANFVPALEAAMRSETFVAPETKFDLETISMQYIGVRNCVQALAGWAESQAATNQMESAASHLGSLYLLTRAMQEKVPLINEMITCSIVTIADIQTIELLHPSTPLALKSRRDLALNILSSLPTSDRLTPLVESEMSFGLLMFQEIRDGTRASNASSPGIPPAGFRLPGWLAREERIYFSGQAGLFSHLMLPNFMKLQERLTMDRARRLAIGAVYSSLAFRAEKGRLPKDLAELSISYPVPADIAEVGLESTATA